MKPTGLAAESGFDPEGLAVAFGVQERSQSIAVCLAHSGDLGAVAVKKNKKDRTFARYLHGVFEEVPRLRPSARRRCPVARTVDAEGEACLVISLNASLRKGRRGRRVGSGTKSV